MEGSIKFYCTTIAFLFIIGPSSAQIPAKYSLGFNLGTFIYQGDLSPWSSGSLKTPSFVIGLVSQKFINPLLATRFELNIGGLKGNEARYQQPAFRQHRAFAFKSSVTELIGSVVYHPLERTAKVSPYLVAGVGYSFLQIKKDYSRFDGEYFINEPSVATGLAEDNKHPLPKGSLVVPVGVGLQYNFTQKLGLVTEASYRLMSNDYLDGFSKAANPKQGDHYYKYSVGLVFNIGVKNDYDCPVIKP